MKTRHFIARGGKYLEVSAEEYAAAHAKAIATRRPARFGLGDAVAKVAEPLAKLSDAVLGTKLVGCAGCARRRAALNRLLPDLKR